MVRSALYLQNCIFTFDYRAQCGLAIKYKYLGRHNLNTGTVNKDYYGNNDITIWTNRKTQCLLWFIYPFLIYI